MLADAAGSFFQPVGAGAVNSGSLGATVEYLRDLVQKNIITLTYTWNVHDGPGTYWTSACPYFASLLSPVLSILIPPVPPFRHSVSDKVIGSI